MTKATMKSLLMTAAMSGLLTGASTAVSASTTSTSNSGGEQHCARPGPVVRVRALRQDRQAYL